MRNRVAMIIKVLGLATILALGFISIISSGGGGGFSFTDDDGRPSFSSNPENNESDVIEYGYVDVSYRNSMYSFTVVLLKSFDFDVR